MLYELTQALIGSGATLRVAPSDEGDYVIFVAGWYDEDEEAVRTHLTVWSCVN